MTMIEIHRDMSILLIEDEPELSRVLRTALREVGYSVDVAHDGESGLIKALGIQYEAIILDLMLPKLSGQEVLQRIRSERDSPVIVLSARDTTADKINGLNLGADDYLTKPFSLAELIARLGSLIRRSANHPSPVVSIGDIQIDTSRRSVVQAGQVVELAAKEYAILELLILKRNQLVSRTEIYDHLYGEEDESLSRVVDVYVCNLRKKLGKKLIETRRGHGYVVRD